MFNKFNNTRFLKYSTIFPILSQSFSSFCEERSPDSLKKKFTTEEVGALVKSGRMIVSNKEKLYDVTKFSDIHPGGKEVLERANGHDISGAWETHFKFHLKPNGIVGQTIKDEQLEFGDLEENNHLPLFLLKNSSKPLRQQGYQHDILNWEPEAKSGIYENDEIYIRNHSSVNTSSSQIKIIVDGDLITLDLKHLRSHPKIERIFVPIICAGAGRGHLKNKPDGTMWGVKGGDAVGAMDVRAVPLLSLLHENFPETIKKFEKNDFAIVVTGADGYKGVIHSQELLLHPERFSLATSYENGSNISIQHGENIRLIVRNAPGFRQIKSVVSLSMIEVPSENVVSEKLKKKLGDTLEHLSKVKRDLLCFCDEFHAYLIRDNKSKKILDFYTFFPLSCAVLHSEKLNNDYTYLTGVAYSGDAKIASVIVEYDEEEHQADLVIHPASDGRFVEWSMTIKNSLNNTVPMIISAVDSEGRKQVIKEIDNRRGVYGHSASVIFQPEKNMEQQSKDNLQSYHP